MASASGRALVEPVFARLNRPVNLNYSNPARQNARRQSHLLLGERLGMLCCDLLILGAQDTRRRCPNIPTAPPMAPIGPAVINPVGGTACILSRSPRQEGPVDFLPAAKASGNSRWQQGLRIC